MERYEINGEQIVDISEEKDLGIVIQNYLKWSKQCVKVSSSGNKILGMIRSTFVYQTKEAIVQLYKSLVRPYLEHCEQAWRPHLEKDIDLLERVQRRALKMIDEFKGMHYVDRLRKVGLPTLETRR